MKVKRTVTGRRLDDLASLKFAQRWGVKTRPVIMIDDDCPCLGLRPIYIFYDLKSDMFVPVALEGDVMENEYPYATPQAEELEVKIIGPIN